MNDHVGKPIDPDTMFATLARWDKLRPTQPPGPPIENVEVASSQSLPDIEGVDLRDGLKRVAGKRRLSRLWAHQQRPRLKAIRREASIRSQLHSKPYDQGGFSRPATAIPRRRFVLCKAFSLGRSSQGDWMLSVLI